MRGNRAGFRQRCGSLGSIPAHAGKPPRVVSLSKSSRVYPRACGETQALLLFYGMDWGLSPRMRGNRFRINRVGTFDGSIPAHAGKPEIIPTKVGHCRVYPRACGETHLVQLVHIVAQGLSPRMRGNRGPGSGRGECPGSIPAHAGKPPRPDRVPRRIRVYPRACGETMGGRRVYSRPSGLSPRMRGNLLHQPFYIRIVGSIPAHAGKPGCNRGLGLGPRVYPRACGETSCECVSASSLRGLSPRMRGNRRGHPVGGDARGSIPAHAGKPKLYDQYVTALGVYPRACGETPGIFSMSVMDRGLSPRMRGNLAGLRRRPPRPGSIPAHAGKPNTGKSKASHTRVYPRACGETAATGASTRRSPGLSPRMRGNRGIPGAAVRGRGSIPAHAGKPGSRRDPRCSPRVYPRACGETFFQPFRKQKSQGLSPRMRGNRLRLLRPVRGRGSIPAHAGKPRTRSRPGWPPWVYPRACGETYEVMLAGEGQTGLSPRMRGNRGRDRRGGVGLGSIPAHAGKPCAE